MTKARILVVDDEEGMLEVCEETLETLPAVEVVLEQDSRRAAERLAAESFDLMITDIRMPGIDGVELLRIAHQQDPELIVLMITAFPVVETAVESMRLGAVDYIVKPFIPDNLRATVKRLLVDRRLQDEHHLLQRQVERSSQFDELVGKSDKMQAVFETIQRIAETDVDVLVTGETGTGKELVARSIHKRSRQGKGPFVPVDCGAIPEGLLESELFGHERGAFTGAHSRSLGLLEFANKGTFFLDEIGELPLHLQSKLLRVLQERRIRRVGGNDEIDVDVRVIAATSRDLDSELRAGRFRRELYYRINVTTIELPPLRERKEDIAILVNHFVARYAREIRERNQDTVQVDPEFLEALIPYPWPGNIRELQNVIKRALTMTRNANLSLDDLPDEIVTHATPSQNKPGEGFFYIRAQHMTVFEREYMSNLLKICHGDVSLAAREAKLPRGTLYRLLKKYGLTPEAFRE